MDDLIRILARARKWLERDAEAASAAIKLVEATPLWENWLSANAMVMKGRAVVADLEEQVRALAVAQYDGTGDKHPHAAVEIKLFSVYDYDPFKAKQYAIEHLPTALSLDTRKFQKAAEVLELDFVKISKEARAQIAADLSDWEGAG